MELNYIKSSRQQKLLSTLNHTTMDEEVIREYVKVGESPIKKGHFMFKMNVDTAEVTKVDIIKGEKGNKMLKMEPGFWYVSALNIPSAQRKLIKRMQTTRLPVEHRILENCKHQFSVHGDRVCILCHKEQVTVMSDAPRSTPLSENDIK